MKSLGGLGKQPLPFQQGKVYDVVVIGGGTGGLSFASEARKLGLSVALFDYVTPSPQGSQWGIGGTCVNVGCIPKKLFHIGSQVNEATHLRGSFGWNVNSQPDHHNWEVLRNNVQNYIKSINFGYKSRLSEIGVDYINAFASFKD